MQCSNNAAVKASGEEVAHAGIYASVSSHFIVPWLVRNVLSIAAPGHGSSQLMTAEAVIFTTEPSQVHPGGARPVLRSVHSRQTMPSELMHHALARIRSESGAGAQSQPWPRGGISLYWF